MKWWRSLWNKHEWRDWFAFDSSFEVTIPNGGSRVVARAMMMRCPCGATRRRPLLVAQSPN